jgi:hypothetical protein
MPFGWAAAAAAVGSIAGGAISASGAEGAAQTQAQGAQNALNTQQGMYNNTLQNEAPFVQSGTAANAQLDYLFGLGTPGQLGPGGQEVTAQSSPSGGYGSLNTPFTADYMKQYSPAYQFQMQQGQQGVLNQDANAQGAESGASLKDLLSFNQNYANTAFNNAFQQYQTQQGNTYNRLMGLASQGQGAASNQATGASNFGQSIGQSATNIGTALGAGQIGAANAYAGTANSLGSYLGAYGAGGGFQGGGITGYGNMSQQGLTMPSTGYDPNAAVGDIPNG